MKVKITCLSLWLVFSVILVKGQGSNSIIKDLTTLIFPENPIDTSVNRNMFVRVAFKIDNPENAGKAHILFGSMKDTPDVRVITPLFVQHNQKFCLNDGITKMPLLDYVDAYQEVNGAKVEIIGYITEAVVKLNTDEMNAWRYLTVYVEDKSGNFSNKLYKSK